MTTLHAQRMERFQQAGLYLVTSEVLSAGRTTLVVLRDALAAGVTLVQLREKGLSVRELTARAREVRRMTTAAGALLLINDRVDVALAVNADGVHVGQDDLPVADARRLAPDMIIGSSSHTIPEAIAAQDAGASYVNIGPLFPTKTKDWTGAYLGLSGLRSIAASITIPFTVMGGITLKHIPELLQAGARTIALVTAVTQARDPAQAARDLLAALHA